jgi:MFS superfamily sulfate permease-like transporter
MQVYRIGKHQLVIFVTTMVTVLATDLLIGVATGIILKMVIHVSNGVPLRTLFKPDVEIRELNEQTTLLVARESAVFSNWIPLRRQIAEAGLEQKKNVVLDLSRTRLVDHSVMVKLIAMQQEFAQDGLTMELRGLDSVQPPVAEKILQEPELELEEFRDKSINTCVKTADMVKQGDFNQIDDDPALPTD